MAIVVNDRVAHGRLNFDLLLGHVLGPEWLYRARVRFLRIDRQGLPPTIPAGRLAASLPWKRLRGITDDTDQRPHAPQLHARAVFSERLGHNAPTALRAERR